jgi:hypothetical protein
MMELTDTELDRLAGIAEKLHPLDGNTNHGVALITAVPRLIAALRGAWAERDCVFEQNALLRKDALYAELQKVMEAHNTALAERDDAREAITLLDRDVFNLDAALKKAEAKNERLRETANDVLAHLVAAISVLSRGGTRKAAPSAKMFSQMLKDYQAAIDRARAAYVIDARPAAPVPPSQGEG